MDKFIATAAFMLIAVLSQAYAHVLFRSDERHQWDRDSALMDKVGALIFQVFAWAAVAMCVWIHSR
jgi:hypothetical protein